MEEFVDEAGNVWIAQVDAQGNPIPGTERPAGQRGRVIDTRAPEDAYNAPQAQETLRGSQLDNQGQAITNSVSAATADDDVRKARADADKAAAEAEKARLEIERARLDMQQGKDPEAAVRAAKSILRLLDREGGIQEQYDANLDGTSILEYLPTSKMRAFDADAGFLKPASKKLYRAKGEGSQSDAEGRDYNDLIPNTWKSDEANEAAIRNLREEAQATLQEYGVEFDPRQDEKGNAADPLAVGPRKFSPSAGPQFEQSSDETYSTPEDLAVAAAVQKVYNGGGSVRDMAEAARGLGYPVNLQNMQQWARAIDYRDAKGEWEGQNTGYATVAPPESGRRSLMGQIYGDFAKSDLGSSVVGLGVGAGNAVSLGGLDEIAGGINSVIRGTSAEDEIAYSNLAKQGAMDAAPLSALTGEFIGGGAMGGMVARRFPGAVKALAGNGKRAATTGAVLGGTTGALEFNDNRAAGAAAGVALGGLGGLAGEKLIGPGVEAIASTDTAQRISRAARKFANTIRPGSATPSALPQVAPEQRVAGGMMGDIDQVRANLAEARDLGLPYSLADASPELRSLAGSAARKSQNARAMAEDVFDPRHRDQASRAIGAIERNLATPVDPTARAKELQRAGQRVAEPYYTMANNRAAPIDEELQAFLNTDTGQEAMKAARRIAQNNGDDPDGLGFTVNDYGDVVLGTYPNFKTLDLIKQGIDAQVYSPANTNPVTGELLSGSPAVRSLEKFRQNYVKVLDRLNEAYPKARAEYAKFAKAREALDLGGKATSPRVKPRDVERVTGNMPDMSIDEYRTGFATSMADAVDNTRLAGDPYERIYGATSQQQKVGQLFPEGADKFRRTYDFERDMAQTRYETIGGSPTAQRMAADDQFTSKALEMGGDVAADIAGGGGGFTAGRLIPAMARGIRDASRLGVGRNAERKADALAPVLYETNTQKAIDQLRQIEDYVKARNARKTKAKRRGGLFGATAPVVILPSE